MCPNLGVFECCSLNPNPLLNTINNTATNTLFTCRYKAHISQHLQTFYFRCTGPITCWIFNNYFYCYYLLLGKLNNNTACLQFLVFNYNTEKQQQNNKIIFLQVGYIEYCTVHTHRDV